MSDPLEKHEKIDIERVPKDENGNALINLFIFLPTSERFVRFIARGTPIEAERLALLQTHVNKDLFHFPSELREVPPKETTLDLPKEITQDPPKETTLDLPKQRPDVQSTELKTREISDYEEKKVMHDFDYKSSGEGAPTGTEALTVKANPSDESKVVISGGPAEATEKLVISGQKIQGKGEIRTILVDTSLDDVPVVPMDDLDPTHIGIHTQARVRKLHENLLSGTVLDPAETLSLVEKQVDQMVAALVPPGKDIKPTLLKALKNLLLMNDVSAITLLAMISALAQGYDSLKSFRDLACACLLMDSSLAEYPREVVEQYYKNPAELSAEAFAEFKKHPQKSFEIAETKVKGLSDVSLQLILHHHEYFNGKGYPRGIRTESLFPMVKVLSLAVNIFEEVQRIQLNKREATFNQIIISMLEEGVEAHLRHHNRKIVSQLIKYLDIDEKNPNQNLFEVKHLGQGAGA